MTQQVFYYGECPECQFSVVVAKIPPKLASNCGLCAEDSGRDVYMQFRPATEDNGLFVLPKLLQVLGKCDQDLDQMPCVAGRFPRLKGHAVMPFGDLWVAVAE